MKKGLSRLSTKGMSRAEWLEERRKGIGGSDAGAIVGLNPYATPYTVWADKTGRLPEKADNEAMRQGRDLEQYVADRFTELTGKKTYKLNAIIKNDKYPWAFANIDRDLRLSQGLECKTTSVLNLKRFKNGEFPATYYAQAVHYMAVTESRRWYVAVLILNQGFKVYQLTRMENDFIPEWCESSVYVSDDEIAALMEAERAFWELVTSDTPPELSGSQVDFNALEAIYHGGDESSVTLFGREKLITQYFELKNRITELEGERDAIKQTLQSDLGDCENGQAEGFAVTWRNQSRSTFDAKAFAKDNPDIDLSSYYKTSTFRKFDIKPLT